MSYQVTVCGNIALPHEEPQAWPTAHYQVELVEPDARIAQSFAKTLYLDQEAQQLGEFDADLIISTIHPDWIPRCDGITHADMAVDEEREQRLHPLPQTHTVCGWILETGQTYSDLWVAHGPLLAYAIAWHKMQDYGTLMVSCVHKGVWNRASWTPTWIDPGCTSEAEMQRRLGEIIPEGDRH